VVCLEHGQDRRIPRGFSGERPQLYTDRQSLMDSSWKIITVLLFGLLAQLPALTMNAFDRVTNYYLVPCPLAGAVFVAA